ncbi:MAG: hypothetical protein M3P48_04670, partial [Actinomycetota bacterium]|nr:hypothetical protein [Actinomycetota bacterium]
PGPFTTEALDAGEAVTCVGAPYGLVPEISRLGSSGTAVRWAVHELPVLPGARGMEPALAEAERELQVTLRESTEALAALDVARWRPEVGDAVRALREGYEEDGMPPDTSARARRVLALGRRVWAIVVLAGEDNGGAATAGEIHRRTAALAPLARASRRAIVAACNDALSPGQPSTER